MRLGSSTGPGQRQRSGCLKALCTIEARGCLSLPEPQSKPGLPKPRRLDSTVPVPTGVPEKVGQVRGLELVPVQCQQDMLLWNSLLLDEHPNGAGPLVGRQLRYLVRSDHGWLGALGFAAPALHLEARDRYDCMGPRNAPDATGSRGLHEPLSRPAVGAMPQSGVACPWHGHVPARPGL